MTDLGGTGAISGKSSSHSMKDESLVLEKILGLTSLSNASVAVCPISGHVAYAAGSNASPFYFSSFVYLLFGSANITGIVVVYDPVTNTQIGFYKAQKAVSCVVFSSDGRRIAAGEKGHAPTISVWTTGSSSAEVQFSGHKNGVGVLCFSPCGEYLVSAGFKHDKQLITWSLKTLKPISLNKLTNKVCGISFSDDSSYFGD